MDPKTVKRKWRRRGAVVLPTMRGMMAAGMNQAVWVAGTVTITLGQALQELAKKVARGPALAWPAREPPPPSRLDDEDPLDTPPAY